MPQQGAQVNTDLDNRPTTGYWEDRGDGTSNWVMKTKTYDGGNDALGATTDTEASGNGSAIAILKYIRTLLSGGVGGGGGGAATLIKTFSATVSDTGSGTEILSAAEIDDYVQVVLIVTNGPVDGVYLRPLIGTFTDDLSFPQHVGIGLRRPGLGSNNVIIEATMNGLLVDVNGLLSLNLLSTAVGGETWTIQIYGLKQPLCDEVQSLYYRYDVNVLPGAETDSPYQFVYINNHAIDLDHNVPWDADVVIEEILFYDLSYQMVDPCMLVHFDMSGYAQGDSVSDAILDALPTRMELYDFQQIYDHPGGDLKIWKAILPAGGQRVMHYGQMSNLVYVGVFDKTATTTWDGAGQRIRFSVRYRRA